MPACGPEAGGIYAAGDIANQFPSLLQRPDRVEHWSQRRRQASPRAGQNNRAEVIYDDLPYFFSDRYDVGMEYVGFANDTGTRW